MKRRSVLVVVALTAVMLAGSASAPSLGGGPGFVLPAPNVPGFVEFHIEDVNGVVAEGSGPAQLKGLVAAYEKKSDAQTYRQDIYTNTDQITPSEGFTGVMATYDIQPATAARPGLQHLRDRRGSLPHVPVPESGGSGGPGSRLLRRPHGRRDDHARDDRAVGRVPRR